MNSVIFSSSRQDWRTPAHLFSLLDSEFHFTLDVCADSDNALTEDYFSISNSCLDHEWFGRVFMNPPYSRNVGRFVKKAFLEIPHCEVIVMLLPVRTDTSWFHDYILNKAEIRFIRGRLRFSDSSSFAPFPSMIAIYKGGVF